MGIVREVNVIFIAYREKTCRILAEIPLKNDLNGYQFSLSSEHIHSYFEGCVEMNVLYCKVLLRYL